MKLLENYKLVYQNVFEALKAFDDILDIIKNFGKADSIKEGLDSDDEDDEFEEDEVKLPKGHPLFNVYQNTDKYSKWVVQHSELFGELVNEEYGSLLKKDSAAISDKERRQISYLKEVSLKVGQILLQAAEKPSSIFSSITYDSDVEDDVEIDGYSAEKAQKEAIKFTKKAVEIGRAHV